MSAGNGVDARNGAAAEYLIRPPVAADALDMGRLHVAVWRQTYPGMMREDVLAGIDPQRAAQQWERIAAAEQDAPDGVLAPLTRIAEHRASGELAGFATVGPARDEHPPVPTQLWAINVLASHHGTGVAAMLLAETIGERAGYLWVVEQNARARAFYRRHGFREDGTTQRDEGLGASEVRMVRRAPA